MSEHLDLLLLRCGDKQRLDDIANNDKEMAPKFAFAHGVTHTRPILATREHRLAANDERPDCKACTVTGGERAPMAHRQCDACRHLARVFQQQRAEVRT